MKFGQPSTAQNNNHIKFYKMKKLQQLVGVKTLSKQEQQEVIGGIHAYCYHDEDCASDEYCDVHSSRGGICIPLRWGIPE